MRISTSTIAALTLVVGVAVLQAADTDVHIGGLQAGKSVEVVGGTKGAVGPSGDLDIAVDATKNWVVYQMGDGTACDVTYRIVVEGSPEDDECQRQDAQGDPCRRCRRVGGIYAGTFSSGDMAMMDGDSNMFRWVAITGAGIGGGVATYFLVREDEANGSTTPGVAFSSLVNKTFLGSGPKSADGCVGVANFFTTATVRLRFVTFNDNGTFTYELEHVNPTPGLPGTVFTGSGTATRNADGSMALTLNAGVNGNFSSTFTGTITANGTQIINGTNPITRSSGCTGPVVYTLASLNAQ